MSRRLDLKATRQMEGQLLLAGNAMAALGAVPLQQLTASATVALPPGYLFGLALSPAGSTSLPIAAGSCRDSTDTDNIVLAAITKTTGSWVAGNNHGGLDTGSIAASTCYHVFAIKNETSGTTDALISLSAASPTMPSGYTLFRRIGATLTDGSKNLIAYVQNGDKFEWKTPILDVNASTPTSNAQNTVTISVPTGITVEAIINASCAYASGGGTALFIYPPFASATPALAWQYASVASNSFAANGRVTTNTSAQILTKLSYGGSTSYSLETLGWIDTRGRLA